MLGMAIDAYSSTTGLPCLAGEPGELVCTRPFPCQPVGFWPLPGFADIEAKEVETAQKRHQAAYFTEFKDVWCKWGNVPNLGKLLFLPSDSPFFFICTPVRSIYLSLYSSLCAIDRCKEKSAKMLTSHSLVHRSRRPCFDHAFAWRQRWWAYHAWAERRCLVRVLL